MNVKYRPSWFTECCGTIEVGARQVCCATAWFKGTGDAPPEAASKLAINGVWTTAAGLFLDDHPAIRSIQAEVDQARAASDESVPLSKRIRAGHNQIVMHERDLKAARERVEEAERNIVAARKSLAPSQGGKRRGGAARAKGPNWNICTDKQQPKRLTEPRARRWKSCSQPVSPSTCPRRHRTAFEGLQCRPLSGRAQGCCERGSRAAAKGRDGDR